MKFYLNAPFHRKESNYEVMPCVVEKIVELPESDFACYLEDLLQNQPFITENQELMKRDQDGVYHCLLVIGKGHDDGILIESEGYDYARYSSFVPNARQIVFMEQRYNCLQDLESSLMQAAEDVITRAGAYNGEGSYRVLISDLTEKNGFDEAYIPLLIQMLNEHSNGMMFEDMVDEIIAHRDQQEEEKRSHSLSDDEIEIMKARHILWLHDEAGGQKADFTNMDLTDCYLADAKLSGAVFKGATLNAATLNNGDFTFCDFTNANLYNVDGVDAVFEESDFSGAKLIGCHFLNAGFMHCRFEKADLTGTDFNMAWMDNSDFTDAKTLNAHLDYARTDHCIGLSADAEDDITQEMTMQ